MFREAADSKRAVCLAVTFDILLCFVSCCIAVIKTGQLLGNFVAVLSRPGKLVTRSNKSGYDK